MKTLLLLFTCISILSCKTEKKTNAPVMFRGDARHSATYSNEAIDSLHGKKWKVKVEGNVFSSPTIYKDVAFIGSEKKFYALDAKTGKEIWSIPVDGPAHSSPAIYNDVVFFGDFSGEFYALSTVDGSKKWTTNFDGERKFGAKGLHEMQPNDQYMMDDWDFYNSSPVIYEGNVYFGSGNGKVYALDVNDGSAIWSFQTGDVVHSSPAVSNGKVYIGSWDSYLYCLDATTGQKQWDFQTGIDTVNFNQVGIQSSPMIQDSIVYFGCRDAHVYALNAISGELIWKKFNNYSWIIVSPVADENNIYYTTSDSYQFKVLDKHTGDSLYTLPTKGFGFSSPILVDGMVYYGVFNGDLVAVNTKTQSEAWRFQTDEAKVDTLEILNDDGTLNGEKVFTEFNPQKMPEIMDMMFSVGAILSTPTPYKESLIFGTADGYVYAIY